MIRSLIAALALACSAFPAFAHQASTESSAFLAGFLHPLGGLDHLLAMITVGLWAALQGGRAIWVWPTAFVSAMLAGAVLGMTGIPLPFVEPGILASTVVLGACVAFSVRAPLSVGAALIAAFAIVHGHAHGAEAPALGSPAEFAIGFALATAILHVAGLALGVGAVQARIPAAVRATGALAAAAGVSLIFG